MIRKIYYNLHKVLSTAGMMAVYAVNRDYNSIVDLAAPKDERVPVRLSNGNHLHIPLGEERQAPKFRLDKPKKVEAPQPKVPRKAYIVNGKLVFTKPGQNL